MKQEKEMIYEVPEVEVLEVVVEKGFGASTGMTEEPEEF